MELGGVSTAMLADGEPRTTWSRTTVDGKITITERETRRSPVAELIASDLHSASGDSRWELTLGGLIMRQPTAITEGEPSAIDFRDHAQVGRGSAPESMSTTPCVYLRTI